ncbi:MAG: LuxR C-terminal-related transcriptional regulator [Christensenellales bacterium]
MSIFYGIVCLISFILLIVYFIIDKKREKWLMCVFISVLVCNTGYFMLSISRNLNLALISNSIAYIGNIFLPFFMLMLILEICNIKHSKILTYSLLAVGLVMIFITTSGGYLPIYYKEVTLQVIEGGALLIKDYGVLHSLYYVYLFGYMIAMISIIIYAIIKKKITSKMHAIFLSIIVLGNILVWFIEQFIENHFEFLCISYIINEGLLLFLYEMLREYEFIKVNKKDENIITNVDMSVLDLTNKLSEEQVALVFTNWQALNILTNREKEILKHILLGQRRKEIAVNLYLSESAVRKYTTSIFRKLEVNNRTELCKKAKKAI